MKLQDVLAAVAASVVFFLLLFAAKWNFFAALAVAVIVYFACSLLFTPRRKIGGVDVESLANGEQLQATFEEAQRDLHTIDKAADQTSSEAVRGSAKSLSACGRSIIQYLETHVDKIPQARRFLNYYLDTAGDIMTRYVDFEKSGAPYSDMQQVQANTLSALKTLNQTFSSQYSRLLSGEVMNMEVDVDVLKKMAASDTSGAFGATVSSADRASKALAYPSLETKGTFIDMTAAEKCHETVAEKSHETAAGKGHETAPETKEGERS